MISEKGKTIVWVLVIIGLVVFIAAILVLWGIGIYNGVIKRDQNVKGSWAEVENLLKRRWDLIPNYVEVVKGYAKHEKGILIKVTEARAKVGAAGSVNEKITAENELSGALSRLLAVVENYPDLKANQNFIRLQDELAGTENRIAVARMRYNESVKAYNKYIRVFPNRIIAGMMGVKDAVFFKAPESEKAVPNVKF